MFKIIRSNKKKNSYISKKHKIWVNFDHSQTRKLNCLYIVLSQVIVRGCINDELFVDVQVFEKFEFLQLTFTQ